MNFYLALTGTIIAFCGFICTTVYAIYRMGEIAGGIRNELQGIKDLLERNWADINKRLEDGSFRFEKIENVQAKHSERISKVEARCEVFHGAID